MEKTLRQIKELHDEYKQNIRQGRHEVGEKLKKLKKIIAQDNLKLLEKDLNSIYKEYEASGEELAKDKESEIRGS